MGALSLLIQRLLQIGLPRMRNLQNDTGMQTIRSRFRARLLLPSIATVALAILSSAVAAGEVVKLKLQSGRKYSLFSSGEIDISRCKTIDTINYRPDIVKQPKYGTLSTGTEERTFRSAAGASPCDGKPFLANILYYQGAKGYKGVDTFVFRKSVFAEFREMTEEVTVELTVE